MARTEATALRPVSDPAPGLPFASCRRIAIVGNAPEMGDHARAIDAADGILRFNNAPGFGRHAGSRVTCLALVNRGGQPREWTADPGFRNRPVIRAASTYLLPFPELPSTQQSGDDRVCWTVPLRQRLAPKPVHILPETLHAEGRHLLAGHGEGTPNPSTGFLATLAVLRDRPTTAAPVDIYGFGFTGWAGHPWNAERLWFERCQRDGRLRLHPLIAA